MIFIAVGTQKFEFNRLLMLVDELVGRGLVSGSVFAQTGNSKYLPKNYEGRDFLSADEFDRYIRECDLLITHGGVGTIVSAMKLQKPMIIVPRLAKYKEHVDDHQTEIAELFADKNYALCYRDGDDLGAMVAFAMEHQFSNYVSKRGAIVDSVRAFLSELR